MDFTNPFMERKGSVANHITYRVRNKNEICSVHNIKYYNM